MNDCSYININLAAAELQGRNFPSITDFAARLEEQ
jgi:hypothetical protein